MRHKSLVLSFLLITITALFIAPVLCFADGVLEDPFTNVFGKWVSAETAALIYATIGALLWRMFAFIAENADTKVGTFWLNVGMRILTILFGSGSLKHTDISDKADPMTKDKIKRDLKKKYPLLNADIG